MFCEEWAKNKFNDDLKEWFPKYKEYEKKGFKIEADTTIFKVYYKKYTFYISLFKKEEDNLLKNYWRIRNSTLGEFCCEVKVNEDPDDMEAVIYNEIINIVDKN